MTWEHFKQTRFHKTLVDLISMVVIGTTAVLLILEGIDWLRGAPLFPLSAAPLIVLAIAFIPTAFWLLGWAVMSMIRFRK